MPFAQFSILNPIKFTDQSVSLDWKTTFPTPDNLPNEQYAFQGATPNTYIKPIQKDEVFNFQFQTDQSGSDIDVQILDCNKQSTSNGTFNFNDITPTGWTGNNISSELHTRNEERIYIAIDIYDEDVLIKRYISELIQVQERMTNCTKVRYSHFQNDYNMIFLDGTTQYVYEMWVRGNYVQNVLPDYEVETYEDERAKPVNLQTSLIDTYKFIVPYTNSDLARRLSYILHFRKQQ